MRIVVRPQNLHLRSEMGMGAKDVLNERPSRCLREFDRAGPVAFGVMHRLYVVVVGSRVHELLFERFLRAIEIHFLPESKSCDTGIVHGPQFVIFRLVEAVGVYC